MSVTRRARNQSPDIDRRVQWERQACTRRWIIFAIFATAFLGLTGHTVGVDSWLAASACVACLGFAGRDLPVWLRAARYRRTKRQLLALLAKYHGRDGSAVVSHEDVFVFRTRQTASTSYLHVLRVATSGEATALPQAQPVPAAFYVVTRSMRMPIMCGATVLASGQDPVAADWTDEALSPDPVFADSDDLGLLLRQLRHALSYKAALRIG